MTVWTWTAVAVITVAAAVPWLLARRGSVRAGEARIAGTVVTRLTVAAVFVWVITRLLRNPDWLDVLASVLVALVLAMSLLSAVVGIRFLIERSDP